MKDRNASCKRWGGIYEMKSEDGIDIITYVVNLKKDPRNALIVKAFLEGMTVGEINKLLDLHGFCGLYSKRYSDIIWMFIFQNHLSETEAKEIICKYLMNKAATMQATNQPTESLLREE